MILKHLITGPEWTLFLDRDGVLNRRIENDYVRTPEDFRFLPGVPEAMSVFSGIFGRIVVVSNQQGVGKGLMTEKDVELIHNRMIVEIEKAGGRIDAVFFCPDLAASGSFNRKPNIGMALQARKRFPEVRFRQSLMVGDSLSDMVFGKRVGMTTVLLGSDLLRIRQNHRTINYVFSGLPALADHLTQI